MPVFSIGACRQRSKGVRRRPHAPHRTIRFIKIFIHDTVVDNRKRCFRSCRWGRRGTGTEPPAGSRRRTPSGGPGDEAPESSTHFRSWQSILLAIMHTIVLNTKNSQPASCYIYWRWRWWGMHSFHPRESPDYWPSVSAVFALLTCRILQCSVVFISSFRLIITMKMDELWCAYFSIRARMRREHFTVMICARRMSV